MDYSLHGAKGNFSEGPMVRRNYTKPLLGITTILRSDNHDFQKSKILFPYITVIFIFLRKSNNCLENYYFYHEAQYFFGMFEITKTYVSFVIIFQIFRIGSYFI
jgi:hypothetical protein